MKVWEKIAQFNDCKGKTKEEISSMAYHTRTCPAEIEEEHHFIGEARFNKHCNIGCGVKCLDEYLELEVKE